jgi:hypothetical protein
MSMSAEFSRPTVTLGIRLPSIDGDGRREARRQPV